MRSASDVRVIAVVAAFAAMIATAGCGGEPRGACTQAQPLGTVCGFENPEDVAYSTASNLLVVSQFRIFGSGGSLAGLTPGASTPRVLWPLPGSTFERDPALGDASCQPPDATVFHPHGIFVDAKNHLYVVNHGGRDSIEVFAVRGAGDAATLDWRGCMMLPPGTAGNDVAVGADGMVVVSNYMSAIDSILDNVKIGLGWVTGDVLTWRAGAGWTHVPGTAASAPNGVAISPDGKTLFYAETGGQRLVRIGFDGTGRAEVEVPGGPDNLSWTSRGTLYLASHTSNLDFLACMIADACRSSWVLLEIDPGSLRVDDVLSHDGSVVGAVASAEQVGPLVYLGAVFGDRIGVWRAPEDSTGSIWSSIAGLAPGRVLAGKAFASCRADDQLAATGAASLSRGAQQS